MNKRHLNTQHQYLTLQLTSFTQFIGTTLVLVTTTCCDKNLSWLGTWKPTLIVTPILMKS